MFFFSSMAASASATLASNLNSNISEFLRVVDRVKTTRPIIRPSDALLNSEFVSDKRVAFSSMGHNFFEAFMPFLNSFRLQGASFPLGVLVGGKACELLLRQRIDSPDIDYELYSLPGSEGQSMYVDDGNLTPPYNTFLNDIMNAIEAHLQRIPTFGYEPMTEEDSKQDREVAVVERDPANRIVNGYYICKIVNKRYYSKVAVLAKINGEVERIVEFKLPSEQRGPIFIQPDTTLIQVGESLFVPSIATLIKNNLDALNYRITKIGEFSLQYDQYIKYIIETAPPNITLLEREHFFRNEIVLYKMRIYSHLERIRLLFTLPNDLQINTSLFNVYLSILYKHSFETIIYNVLPTIISQEVLPSFYTFSTPANLLTTMTLLERQNQGILSDGSRFTLLDKIDEKIAAYSALATAPLAPSLDVSTLAPSLDVSTLAPSLDVAPALAVNTGRVTPELPEIDFIPITEEESNKQIKEANILMKLPPQIIAVAIEKKRDKLISDRSQYFRERKEKKKKAKAAQQKLELREKFKKEFNKNQAAVINAEYTKAMAEKIEAVKDQYNLVLEPLVYAPETESNGYDNFLLEYYRRIQFKTEIIDISENQLINILYFMLIDYMNKFIIPDTELTAPFVKMFISTFYSSILQPLLYIVPTGPLHTKIDKLLQKVGAIKDIYTIKSDFKNIYLVLMTDYFSLIAALSKNILSLDINTNNPVVDIPLLGLLTAVSKITTETKIILLRDSLNFFCEIYSTLLQLLIRTIKDQQTNKSLIPTLVFSTKSAIHIEHYELIIAILTSKGLNKIQFTLSQYPAIEAFKSNYTIALNFFETLYNKTNPDAKYPDIERAYWKSWNQGRFFESFERENIDLHYLEIMLGAFMKMPMYESNMKINETIDTYFDLAAIKQKKRDIRIAIGYCQIQVTDRKNVVLFTFNCLKIIHFFYLLNKYSKKILYKFLLINESFYDIFDAICKCESADSLLFVVTRLLEEEKKTYKNIIPYLVANIARDASASANGITTVSRNQLAKILASPGISVSSYKNAASAAALGVKGPGPKAPGSGQGPGPKAPGSGSKGGRRKVTQKLRRKVGNIKISKKTRTKQG